MACAIWAGVGPNRAMVGLGYGREAPRIKRSIGWIPFFTDLGGPMVPFDDILAGQEALISVTLNYYRADSLALVEATATGGADLASPPGARGSLAIFEGLTYPVALVFPNYLKPVYRAAGMPPGIRLFACHVESFDDTQGLRPKEVNIIWKAREVFQPQNGGFLLGDRNVTGLAPFVV